MKLRTLNLHIIKVLISPEKEISLLLSEHTKLLLKSYILYFLPLSKLLLHYLIIDMHTLVFS